ncbi:hypothetical protein [Planctomycetes bacterium CA13]|uniref:hypothetical protein n=1 Tax=Novipirellula herctigrandis TaxID=2527986 RepID=UPI0011B46027
MVLENSKRSLELRQQPVGVGTRKTYRAIYTIQDNTVYVLTVRRSSQDTLSAAELDDVLAELKQFRE